VLIGCYRGGAVEVEREHRVGGQDGLGDALPRRQVCQRPVFEFGDDSFDEG
jgi:hypothetical protein